MIGFGATFAVTQTIAAVGFPIIILALVPIRTWVLPRWFGEEELRVLDQPTASPFTMISVGGNYGESGEELNPNAREIGDGVLAAGGAGDQTPGEDSDEARAERGESQGVKMKRRESWKSDDRSGRWAGEGGNAGPSESYEMKKPGMMRRSVSRASKE